ncbi:hypothetical protein QJS10_CPA01g02222 [Acorus calamus]|uniref:Uncharacterized protein n=1 Tax=Acorus calamus TaxID=4465 RepID=A0AAV9FG99_ACOCL|nr:hypothetical protein QJS10_CPA01g02222 [Acorus calamus]
MIEASGGPPKKGQRTAAPPIIGLDGVVKRGRGRPPSLRLGSSDLLFASLLEKYGWPWVMSGLGPPVGPALSKPSPAEAL